MDSYTKKSSRFCNAAFRPHCPRHFLATSIRHYPQLAPRHSAALAKHFLAGICPHWSQAFPVTLPPAFPATFIWNGDLPSQGIVRQVGCPNGSISLPSAQPTCPTDMRGWWVGVQMIVTSLMNYLQALPCGILPALPPNFHVTFQWESARIASGISLQYPSDNIRNLPRGIQWHCPTIST